MSREMRIIWLHNRLSTNDKASMKEYTQKFGISSRQALRDFRYLRINLGAPLKYSRKRGKYFYSESYRLPSLFEDSMKSQMIAEDRVSFTLLKAVERKKAVRLVLRGEVNSYSILLALTRGTRYSTEYTKMDIYVS